MTKETTGALQFMVAFALLMSSSCGTSRLRIVGLADETELVSLAIR